jgi:hypothetical protein
MKNCSINKIMFEDKNLNLTLQNSKVENIRQNLAYYSNNNEYLINESFLNLKILFSKVNIILIHNYKLSVHFNNSHNHYVFGVDITGNEVNYFSKNISIKRLNIGYSKGRIITDENEIQNRNCSLVNMDWIDQYNNSKKEVKCIKKNKYDYDSKMLILETLIIVVFSFVFVPISIILAQFIDLNFYKNMMYMGINIFFYYNENYHIIVFIFTIDLLYMFYLSISFIFSKKKEIYYDINYFINILLFRSEKNKFKFKNLTVYSALFVPSSIFKSFWFFLLIKIYLGFLTLIREFFRCEYYDNIVVKYISELRESIETCSFKFNKFSEITKYLSVSYFIINLIILLILLFFLYQRKLKLRKR